MHRRDICLQKRQWIYIRRYTAAQILPPSVPIDTTHRLGHVENRIYPIRRQPPIPTRYSSMNTPPHCLVPFQTMKSLCLQPNLPVTPPPFLPSSNNTPVRPRINSPISTIPLPLLLDLACPPRRRAMFLDNHYLIAACSTPLTPRLSPLLDDDSFDSFGFATYWGRSRRWWCVADFDCLRDAAGTG